MARVLRSAALFLIVLLAASLLTAAPKPGEADEQAEPADVESRLVQQVTAAEKGFAQTMADRDLEGFATYVSHEAVFLGRTVLRGRQAVVDGWGPLFEGEAAPFSWRPETVEVLDSENLALSTGPVFDAEGNQISIFTSIWRQEEPGIWRVIFDRGTKYCE